eukprot:TRINITY_DN1307_c0_g1_i2.p1 TRINITY_DN1307_c0_g1~~TRINITY_DN1307_c0_g1_i2.p1  ORF type:complete len:245 (-),score=61.51 TRINITY_DN1307_c0_g1_i2:190-864(-)
MNKNNKGVDPDDVDSLIEEWQTSFGNEKKEPTTKEKLKTTAPTPKKEPLKASTITQSKPQKNEIDNEIDDLLSDISVTNDISTPTLSTVKSTTTKTIVTPTPTTATQKTAPSSSVTPSPSSSSAKKRCDPLCIGGSKDIAGVTLSMVSQKKCTNIRCSGCDFKVVSFIIAKIPFVVSFVSFFLSALILSISWAYINKSFQERILLLHSTVYSILLTFGCINKNF